MGSPTDPRCCAICATTGAETVYQLMQFRCGHILCPLCQASPCPVCEAERPAEDALTPLAQCIADGTALLWAYGELYDVPETARFAQEQLALVLTCLRLWAEDAGMDTADAWRDAWQRSVAIRTARKVS